MQLQRMLEDDRKPAISKSPEVYADPVLWASN